MRPPVILKEANRYRRRRGLTNVVALVPSTWFNETRRVRLARFGVELVGAKNNQPPSDVCKWYLFGPNDWVHGPDAERIGLFFGNREEVDLGIWRDPNADLIAEREFRMTMEGW